MKKSFVEQQDKPLTLLGFDFGMKSIGVAVGQTVTREARPLMALRANAGVPDWKEVAQIIEEWRPDVLVVGIPLNMDGTEQSVTKAARKFVKCLEQRFGLPVCQTDERLTTVEARARLFDEGGFRSIKKAAVDAMAAKLILEGWMKEGE